MIKATLKQMSTHKPGKIVVLLFTVLSCFVTSHAQTVPKSNRAGTTGSVRETSKEIDIRERLVQLAMQNPNYEVADHKVMVADYQLKKSKGSWLSSITGTYNINQFNLEGTNANNNFFPRYNFGLTLPFDIFTRTGTDIKIAKENLSIAQAEKTQRYREIRTKVLTKYEDFLMYQQKLEFQSQITQDEHSAFLTAEKAFGDGVLKQEDYRKASRAYADEQSKMVDLQRNYNVIKIELQELIGIPIDDVLKKK
jgi:outer membrane protein TolC